MASAGLAVPRAEPLAGPSPLSSPSLIASARPETAQAEGTDAAPPDHQQLIARYCVTCHNQRARTGDLALDEADLAHVEADPEIWEAVVRKLRTGTMPPSGMPRPDPAEASRLVGWLEGELDAASAGPHPGRQLLRRLNRAEYANAVRDLFGLELDVRSLLPADDSAFGFDNIADLLVMSPALLERYLVAADQVSALAVGDMDMAPGSETYRVRGDQSQDGHLDGLPLGTVGGLAVEHVFPLDGEYEFQLSLFRTNLEAIRGLEHPHQIEVSVDGERVFLETVGGEADQGREGTITEQSDVVDARLNVRAPVRAGRRVVTAAFIQKIGEGTNRLRPFLRSNSGTYDSTGRPHIETMTVTGPFEATGRGDTEARRRVFVCRPESVGGEEPCAAEILSTLARRAYRRPVTSADLEQLMPFFREGREKGSFDSGIQLALRRLLASPSFLFRLEATAPADAEDVYVVDDLALATRLSFFLWSSIPDDVLLDVAERGELRDPGVLEAQVRRMLADPRAHALAENFAGQWLHVRNLRNIAPNSDEFPDFDNNLRDAFRTEVELFFDSVRQEDRNVLDLMTADYTFVNERLARHYGIPGVYGSRFRRVAVPSDARRGLLGKGSVLLATSHADRTAPTLRGKWILENLLGTPPPAPPADVPPLPTQPGAAPRTMRERMDIHRASPACASCHQLMDPLGFAMENFDAVGGWRREEAGVPINATGALAGTGEVDGVIELREALLDTPVVFIQTFTEKLLTYALGRGLQYYDMPVVRGIVREAATEDHRFSAVVLGIVNSPPFQMRALPAE
jgi:mono/diheme cytochrome c family protein